MQYTASQLVQRGLKLADLTNTDFFTYPELIDYTNDSYAALYQSIINNGDKVFCKEVNLTSTGNVDIPLPEDFYMMHSLVDKYSGRVYVRAATSQGDWSNTYEIFNNKLRLKGISASELILTYYPKPTFVSFPDKVVDLDIDSNIISSCKNNVLLSSGSIYNLMTLDKLGEISIQPGRKYVLGDGFVTVQNGSNITYISYTGTALATYTATNATLLNDGYYLIDTTIKFRDRTIAENIEQVAGETIYVDSEENIFSHKGLFKQVASFNNELAYVFQDEVTNKLYLKHGDFEDELDIKYFDILAVVDYGFVTTNGTNVVLQSCVPDTIMDFPGNIYFQLLAYELAVRFTAKQNAQNDQLMMSYAAAQVVYKKSLNQNAGPQRIANVY